MDARKQCEISETDDTHDRHLTRLLQVATRDVERLTRRALITQTWQLVLDEFPAEEIDIPRPPLQSLTIQYVDSNGSTQSFTDYQIEYSSPACVSPAYNKVWPATRPETENAVTVTFVAGFGSLPSDVPAEYQNVISELLAFRFFNRGDEQAKIPDHIQWSLKSLHCGAKMGYYEL